ncbi:hypothetical protein [Halioglobus sp. HI00S01]|uniref:hypothetical protein n=1 Tax=Halioglobus sp. HI00S01 TaxID=1822214 RepID=UPI0012E766EF|nr:hypothetical protein [Halioglobus sp. HI00S01]
MYLSSWLSSSLAIQDKHDNLSWDIVDYEGSMTTITVLRFANGTPMQVESSA